MPAPQPLSRPTAGRGIPGHGLQYILTRSVNGKMARHLKPGPEPGKIRREVAENERFRDLVGQVTWVSPGGRLVP